MRNVFSFREWSGWDYQLAGSLRGGKEEAGRSLDSSLREILFSLLLSE